MKKTFSFSLMAVAFIATLILSGCQQDANTLRVRIDNFGGNGKVYMGGDRFNVPTWSSGDTIWIDHGNRSDNRYFLTNFVDGAARLTVPSYPTYCALYPYTLLGTGTVTGTTATITIPDVQPYYTKNGNQVVNAPMAAYTGNDSPGNMTFHNLGALLAIKIENNYSYAIDVDEVIVESLPVVIDNVTQPRLPLWGSATVDLSNPQAIYQCTPSTVSGANPYKVSLKKFTDNTHSACTTMFQLAHDEYKTVYVYVPAVPTVANNQYAPNRYKITVNAHHGSENISTPREQHSTHGGSIPRNVMAKIDFLMQNENVPYGAVEGGKFTVCKDGNTVTKVYFAAGNLQYNCTTNVWRIADNQWDYVGGSSSTNSGNVLIDPDGSSLSYNEGIRNANYTGWIDLFGWGTSGYHNTSDVNNTRFMPTDYVNSEVNATYNKYGYGPSTNRTDANYLQGANANYDWGVYHSNVSGNNNGILQYQGQAVGSNVTWRTLTMNEWKYLLATRSVDGVAAHKGKHWSWSPVTYKSRYGILIYPDGYTDQLTNSSSRHYTFGSNEDIPTGCVFLPLTYQRSYADNTIQISTNNYCYYWTSQSGNSSASNENAIAVQFHPGVAAYTCDYTPFSRCLGNAVRLVTNVPSN